MKSSIGKVGWVSFKCLKIYLVLSTKVIPQSNKITKYKLRARIITSNDYNNLVVVLCMKNETRKLEWKRSDKEYK